MAGTYGSDTPFANTFWWRNGNAQQPSQGELDLLIHDFGTKFVTHFAPLLNPGVVWTNVDAYYYGSAGVALASAATLTGQGTKGTIIPPAHVSLCVGWRVQQHYRGGHPRTYLPGPAGDSYSGGRRFTTGYVTSVQDAANLFHTDVNALSGSSMGLMKLGVVSFVLRNEWRAPPVFRDFNPNGAHVDARVDSMRRRLGRDIPP